MKSTSKRKSKSPTTQKKESNMKNIVLVGAGLTATGIVGYFGYQYLKKMKEEQEQQAKRTLPVSAFTPPSTDTTPKYTPPPDTNTTYKPPTYHAPKDTNTYTPPKPKSDFPLKKGSKGVKVKNLQLALIATYGKSILPNYGADGDFGKELANGLKKLKYPATVSEVCTM